MNAEPMLPQTVEMYLRAYFFERTRPLLLSFGPDWTLRDVQGDASLFGIDVDAPDGGLSELKDLFLGVPVDGDHDLSFVELSGGRSAHIHLVADGTREHSLSVALNLLMQSRTALPDAVVALAVNKLDLVERWEVAPATLAELRRSLPVFETSALSGAGVEQAFAEIAARLRA